jgi:hypothetical protein
VEAAERSPNTTPTAIREVARKGVAAVRTMAGQTKPFR